MQYIWYNTDAKVLAITWTACLDSNIWPWQCPLLHQILRTYVSSDSNSEHFIRSLCGNFFVCDLYACMLTWQEISYIHMVTSRIVQKELSHLSIKRAQCCLSISWCSLSSRSSLHDSLGSCQTVWTACCSGSCQCLARIEYFCIWAFVNVVTPCSTSLVFLPVPSRIM